MNRDLKDRTGVVVVDDDPMLRRTWARMLDRPEFEVWFCSSGDEALEVLARHSVDVVITDVDMPGISGLDLLEHVKRCDPAIEVVVMSGMGRLSDMTRAARAGAYAYIAKPFHDVQRCVQMVQRAGRRRRHQPSAPPIAHLAS